MRDAGCSVQEASLRDALCYLAGVSNIIYPGFWRYDNDEPAGWERRVCERRGENGTQMRGDMRAGWQGEGEEGQRVLLVLNAHTSEEGRSRNQGPVWPCSMWLLLVACNNAPLLIATWRCNTNRGS